MLVDVEFDVVFPLRSVLEETELIQVDGHTDPILALSNIKPDTYDLVVLDIRMPVMNGFELCKNIKAVDGWAKVCS